MAPTSVQPSSMSVVACFCDFSRCGEPAPNLRHGKKQQAAPAGQATTKAEDAIGATPLDVIDQKLGKQAASPTRRRRWPNRRRTSRSAAACRTSVRAAAQFGTLPIQATAKPTQSTEGELKLPQVLGIGGGQQAKVKDRKADGEYGARPRAIEQPADQWSGQADASAPIRRIDRNDLATVPAEGL